MALISCARAVSPLDDVIDEETEFYLADYLEPKEFGDSDSMVVNSASLLEAEGTIKSQKKLILLKRLLSRRKRKVERRITLHSSFPRSLPEALKMISSSNPNQTLGGTKSQLDINTIERRIELSELDRRNSIGNL